jgi:DNA-binding response OmpR family regulator
VTTCLTVEDACQALLTNPVDLAIVDLNLEKENGLQFLQWFRRSHPTVPIAILTGLDPEVVKPKLVELEVLEIIAKPLTIPQIQQRIQAIVVKFPQSPQI